MLPCMPSQLNIVVVRRKGNAGSLSHEDFKVRRSRVMLTVLLSQTTCTYDGVIFQHLVFPSLAFQQLSN